MLDKIRTLFGGQPEYCQKCPYKLGLVHTFVDPCPQCKMNNYSFYRMFLKQLGLPEDTELPCDDKTE